MTDRQTRPSLPVRILYAVPIIGWMIRDFANGDDKAMMWFALTMFCIVGIATLTFGLPGLVVVMLFATALTLAVILLVTFG